jgi:hypothetical protein
MKPENEIFDKPEPQKKLTGSATLLLNMYRYRNPITYVSHVNL